VVVATGMDTELGKISSLVEEAEEERTPLEKRLDELARKLIVVTLVIAGFIALTGILAGREVFLMIETGIALAVAAVPEGLPIVATIALARGMWRMARRNALVNRLSAVETLGATNIICADKTGTLTENRMTVREFLFDSGPVKVNGKEDSAAAFSREGQEILPGDLPVLREALEVAVLCNNASLGGDEGQGVGDPLEVALLAAAEKGGIRRGEMNEKFPEVREEAFDPDVKKMATFHKEDRKYRVAVKGAPESVLEVCTRLRRPEGDREMTPEDRKYWLTQNDRMAEQGLRILALAAKQVPGVENNPYEDLIFLGLVGMVDPPREDVREAVLSCRRAGIRVVMVTGDQVETARNIGQAVGLIGEKGSAEVIEGRALENLDELDAKEKDRFLRASIFARVSPKQKLDLISLYQKDGAVVAMTGDGVNDAPALKKADIGVAMGQRGTQVAREAADMVLKDDSFPTIVAAVEEGRVIFENIRKFVLYLLSCNVSEILAVSLASFANAPLPILPLQILFLNLVTDIFPALALGVGEGNPEIMKQKPRDPREPILTRRHWRAIGGYGVVITFSVLGALGLAVLWLEMDKDRAVTVSFLTLAFAQLWHVFNMRGRDSRFWFNEITKNLYVWGALVLCTGLLLLAVYLPGLSQVLKVVSPGHEGWLLVIVMSLIPYGLGQIRKTWGGQSDMGR
jgi:Ca2+-transporting ATPase